MVLVLNIFSCGSHGQSLATNHHTLWFRAEVGFLLTYTTLTLANQNTLANYMPPKCHHCLLE